MLIDINEQEAKLISDTMSNCIDNNLTSIDKEAARKIYERMCLLLNVVDMENTINEYKDQLLRMEP